MAADIVLCLPAGATARLNHLAGYSVCGQQGTVWLTVEGEPEDVLLECGDRYRVPTHGHVVLEALGAPAVALVQRQPRPRSCRAHRALMTWRAGG